MKTTALILAASMVSAGALLAGCGSDYESPPPAEQPEPSPPAPPPVDFTRFVTDQFRSTSADNDDPVAVDDTEFRFNDQDNPAAFDDLLDGNP